MYSLDNKGSCWILKDFYCSVTMLRELEFMKAGPQFHVGTDEMPKFIINFHRAAGANEADNFAKHL